MLQRAKCYYYIYKRTLVNLFIVAVHSYSGVYQEYWEHFQSMLFHRVTLSPSQCPHAQAVAVQRGPAGAAGNEAHKPAVGSGNTSGIWVGVGFGVAVVFSAL